MNAFSTLYGRTRPMVEHRLAPDSRTSLFPEVVRQSKRLHLWRPGDPFPLQGLRLLIGVAVWNRYDMILLDAIEQAKDFSDGSSLHIDVCDLDDCRNMDEVLAIFPGLASLPQTPGVGLWSGGILQQAAGGHQGRLLAAKICNVDASALQNRLSSTDKSI